ncbi:MAG: TIGR01777 family oxidoreductase [Leptospiraceae bacterium]|nr:TIGR01777 family oxidoreductase [Leptospiraceae bacterium]
MKSALITGASGLLGQEVAALLQSQGWEVRGLSRRPRSADGIHWYEWNPSRSVLDETSLEDLDVLIHLAGEGIADGRWTEGRKREIIQSRVQSCDLLAASVRRKRAEGKAPGAIVLASAIGYYGSRGDEWLVEDSKPGTGFLSETTLEWEKAGDFPDDIRQVRLRIGIVLSRNGGALPQMERPLRFFAGAVPGSGNQYLSWIHQRDMARIIQFAAETQLRGTFNATAPEPESMDSFMRKLGSAIGRPVYLPNVPSFALRLMMGEMSEMVLGGARVSSEKIQREGFQFEFPNLEKALGDLYGQTVSSEG